MGEREPKAGTLPTATAAPTSPGAPRLVGVVNLTPDSKCEVYRTEPEILARARELRELGVEIVDVGARSSTLEGGDFSAAEESERLLAALRLLHGEGFKVSIDSWSGEVAERCAEAGADILNDTSGSGSDDVIEVAGRFGKTLVLNWVSGANPRLRRLVTPDEDLIGPMIPYFEEKIARARAAGATDLILDPGMGFLKTRDAADKTRVQLQVMSQLGRLRSLGYPLFTIAPIRDPYDPLTPSTVMLYHYALESGADYIRVHYPEYLREIQQLTAWWRGKAPQT